MTDENPKEFYSFCEDEEDEECEISFDKEKENDENNEVNMNISMEQAFESENNENIQEENNISIVIDSNVKEIISIEEINPNVGILKNFDKKANFNFTNSPGNDTNNKKPNLCELILENINRERKTKSCVINNNNINMNQPITNESNNEILVISTNAGKILI
jgi:hypothetical protein